MPISIVNTATPVNEILWNNTSIGNHLDVVKNSSGVLFYLTISNINVFPVFLKLFDQPVGLTVLGTTAPDLIYRCPGTAVGNTPTVSNFTLFTGTAFGYTFNNGIIAACVTTPGTGGTTPPITAISATFSYV